MAQITLVFHDKPQGGVDVTMHAEPRPVAGVEAYTDAQRLAVMALNAVDAAINEINGAPQLLIVEADGSIKKH